jgi:hypothetical protein
MLTAGSPDNGNREYPPTPQSVTIKCRVTINCRVIINHGFATLQRPARSVRSVESVRCPPTLYNPLPDLLRAHTPSPPSSITSRRRSAVPRSCPRLPLADPAPPRDRSRQRPPVMTVGHEPRPLSSMRRFGGYWKSSTGGGRWRSYGRYWQRRWWTPCCRHRPVGNRNRPRSYAGCGPR